MRVSPATTSSAALGRRARHPRSTDFLRDVSLFGGTTGSILIAVAVAVVVSRRLSPRSVVAFLAVVMIGQTVLFNVIKVIVDRTRPDIDRLTGFSGASFPSGHATTTAATFASAALLLGYSRGRVGRAVLGDRGRYRRGRRRVARLSRRALAHRRDRRRDPRLGVVRGRLDRVRWPPPALRGARRGGRAGRPRHRRLRRATTGRET